MTTLKTASVLAFERKLNNSDGYMFSGNWDEGKWLPIRVQSKSVRGTISNRLKANITSDPAKLDAEIQKPNLQTVEVAALPFDADTLKVDFSLRVLGDLSIPSACNDQSYQTALSGIIDAYIKEHQFHELAGRFAENLANGRFLWRNRLGAENVKIRVSLIENKSEMKVWIFQAFDFSLKKFSEPVNALLELKEAIRLGLCGEKFTLLKVEAFSKLGVGQEVFPSQELVLSDSRDSKGKYLYQISDVAALHSQKIGNALRTIDTWYPNSEQFGPIAVEPYGSVTNRGTAYRQPKEKVDFYHLLDNWVLKNKIPPVEQQHYVMAVFVRGGVFGEKAD